MGFRGSSETMTLFLLAVWLIFSFEKSIRREGSQSFKNVTVVKMISGFRICRKNSERTRQVIKPQRAPQWKPGEKEWPLFQIVATRKPDGINIRHAILRSQSTNNISTTSLQRWNDSQLFRERFRKGCHLRSQGHNHRKLRKKTSFVIANLLQISK